ncbi:hypothetical protein [Promicromonospora sukumoe]|uniref:hypothetical protein n=1 Tax=Promicromonospora sukumoe TaxID=88382 RepID=UPI0036511EDB
MGFTGHLVVARSDGPLPKVSLLESIAEDHPPDVIVDQAWLTTAGWQQVHVEAGYWDEEHPTALADLVRETGAPACSAWVLDSDCAIVTGLAPGGRPWRTALHLDTVLHYAEDDPEAVFCPDGMDPEEFVRRLDAHIPHAAANVIAWAIAAGFPAVDPARIEDLLRTRSDFVEETFDDVLAAFGFPTPRSAARA